MEKTITLTSDELCEIVLTLTDKVNSIESSVKLLGGQKIPNALKRKETLENLIYKLMNNLI